MGVNNSLFEKTDLYKLNDVNVCTMFQVGQEIEVRPGLVSKDAEGKLTCKPIFSRIVSLYAEQNELMYAVPGGLIGKWYIFLRKKCSLTVLKLLRCWYND